MDGLPPIRNMSLTQQRIRDALKNAPPLKVTKMSTNDDFIVFEVQKKDSNSLFDRFLKHKNSMNGSESKNTKKSVHKWTELKDQMTQELETKRMESQKHKDINHKIENEELDEEVDGQVDEEFNSKEDIEEADDQLDSRSAKVKSNAETVDSEPNDSSSDDNEENNSDEDDLIPQSDDSEEEVESDGEVNPFLDDEADEEVVDKVDRNFDYDSDESRDSFGINSVENEPLAQEECDDNQQNNGLNDSFLNASFTSFDSYNGRKCATQKIALSPFITQRPKPRFNSEQHFPELVSNLESNNEEFNSQSLLDLCSGNFIETVPTVNTDIGTQSQTPLENDSQTDDKPIDSHLDSDNESEKEVEEVIKSKRKVFNIDSDGEDNEDNDNLKSIQQIKSFNESDGEELVVTEDEIGDEEIDDQSEEQEEQNVNSFFDNEAELSGDDEVSSDEDDGEDEEQEEEEEADKEDLPSDSEIEDQNKRFFNKQILDEEKRNIMLWKEKLFEDGDLHDGGQRKKKFRWNFEADDNFVNDYINEDSDDNYIESDDDQKTKVPELKFKLKADLSSDVDNKISQNLDKFKSNTKFNTRSLSKTMSSDSKSNSISSFVVRDERLKTIMSFKSKRTSNSVMTFKSNKKLKTSKETKKSIFDLLKQYN